MWRDLRDALLLYLGLALIIGLPIWAVLFFWLAH